MAEIRMHDGSQIEWLSLRQIVDDKMAATLDDADLDSLMATHEKGDINDPVLQEFKQLAGSKALPHAHDVPEIIYLLEGSMHVTGRELGAGSSACIGQDTVYGFEAGKDGARVLIFMQRGEYAYWNQKSFTKLVKEGAREFAKPVAVSVAADEVEWRRLGDVYPPEYARNLTAADLDVQIGAHYKGENGGIAVDELKMPAGAKIPSHAHDVPEHVYVIEGSLGIGNRKIDAGSSAYIGPETLYSLKAGDKGARVIVFVQRGDYKSFLPEDMKAKARVAA